MCTKGCLTTVCIFPGPQKARGKEQLFLSYFLGGGDNSQRQAALVPHQSLCIAKGCLNRKGDIGKGFYMEQNVDNDTSNSKPRKR